MANRAGDWLKQAARDLEQVEDSRRAGRHEWACFAAQQAAEKAVKALHLHAGQEAWGHVVAMLLGELPQDHHPSSNLIEKGRILDNFYIPFRYPNSHPQGAPFEHYGPLHSDEASAMPVRSLRSSVLKWPDARVVDEAVRRWSDQIARRRPDVERIGYFGSYARGDWGVGSDLDLVMVVAHSALPFERRGAEWDVTGLPVPADVLVYTHREWEALDKQSRFYRTLVRETVWVYRI